MGGLGGGNSLGGIANTKLNSSITHRVYTWHGGGSAPLDLDARNGGPHASQVTQELLGWGIQGIRARVKSTNIFQIYPSENYYYKRTAA